MAMLSDKARDGMSRVQETAQGTWSLVTVWSGLDTEDTVLWQAECCLAHLSEMPSAHVFSIADFKKLKEPLLPGL